MKISSKWLLFLAVPFLLIGCSGTPGTSTSTSSGNGSTGGATAGTFTIGGTVAGLTGTGMVLQDNGGDNLAVTGNGTFAFKTGIASGKTYGVTILTQPTNQICAVTGGSGTATANVTSVQIACAVPNATISANVTGLSSPGLIIQNNGNDNLTVNSSGTSSFKNSVTGTYNVIVLTQPASPNEICTVANGSGIATASTVTVNVSCVLSYTIGGTVNGLVGTGMVLQDNGGNNLAVSSSGVFKFTNQLPTGTPYAVTILTQPSNPAQNCTVANASGTASANVTSVVINCPAATYTIGGVIVGLEGQTPNPPTQVNVPLTNNNHFVLTNELNDNFFVTQNGPFTFAQTEALNNPYDVNYSTGPNTQSQGCTRWNWTGVVSANVTNIVIDCGHNDWTWINGSNIAGVISAPQYGLFPTSPPTTIPNPFTNTPGARNGGAGWTDSSGNLWLFGGQGWELSGKSPADTLYGDLNDLWECQIINDYCEWQLVNGYSSTPSNLLPPATTIGGDLIELAQNEENGTITSGPLTVPRSRWGAANWTDSTKTVFWLFGGIGSSAFLGDLWNYNTGTSTWTHVSGSLSPDQSGVYTGGSPAPGSRSGAVTWTDQNGNFWLFGGLGYDGAGNVGLLNDLWEYNGTNWIFVSASATMSINQNGIYTGSTPYPGGRQSAVGWTDASGNLWMYGGEGEDVGGTANGVLADLWKYNISTGKWTFVAGSSTANQTGVYGNAPLIGPPSTISAAGTVGLTGATAGTHPGSRWGSAAWTDPDGHLWLFGGYGLDATGINGNGPLNDLWVYDIGSNTWTWTKGSTTGGQNGVYGDLTRPYKTFVNYTPGGRNGATYWTDGAGQLWLFGGEGLDSTSSTGNGFLNDLWRYLPYP